MAITQYAGDRFVAATTDTKPTGVLPGAFLTVSGDGSRTNYIKTGYTHEAWVAIGGGGGAGNPGGSNTQVQFNDNGSFGGDTDLTFTNGNQLNVNKLSIAGNLIDSNSSIGEGGMVLANEGTTGVHWKNIESVLSGVGGSGVANYVARWSDEDTLTTGALVDNGTKVGIGTATPTQFLDILATQESDAGIRVTLNCDLDSQGPQLILNRAAQNGGIVDDGDVLGIIKFGGYDGNSVENSAKIEATVNGTPSNDNMPTDLSFYTASAGTALERMRIASDGKVGIGTNDPSFTLHANHTNGGAVGLTRTAGSTAGVLGNIWFGNIDVDTTIANIRGVQDGATDSAKLVFQTEVAGGSLTERMVIKSDGNVGIGTTGPARRLEVLGGAVGVQARLAAASGWGTGLEFYDGDSAGRHWRIGTSQSVAGDFVFMAGASTGAAPTVARVSILPDGKVGIGTTAPAQALHVAGGNLSTIRNNMFGITSNTPAAGGETNAYHNAYYDTTNSREEYLVADEACKIQFVNGQINFRTAVAGSADGAITWINAMGILADGNVGIGVVAPWTRFTVAGGTTAEADDFIQMSVTPSVAGGNSAGVLFGVHPTAGYAKQGIFWERYVGNGGYGGRGKLHFVNRDAVDDSVPTVADSKMTILEDGNVGIGTTSPSTLLHIDDDTSAAGLTIKGAGPGYVNAAIVLKATNSTSYRGLGVFMHDAGGDTEWYAGTPYAAADQYMIARKASQASPDYGTAVTGNALFTVKNDGKVGIGTTDPDYKIDVVSSDHKTIKAESTGNDRAEVLINKSGGTAWSWSLAVAGSSNGYSVADKNFYIADTTGGAARLVINNSGNVGIGTATPQQSLQVGAIDTANDGVRVTNAGSLNNKSVLGFGGSYIQPMAAVGGVVENAVGFTAGGLYFSTRTATSDAAPTERMRLTSGGNFGINCTNPATRFAVQHTDGGTGIEFSMGATLSYIQCYSRSASDYKDLKIDAENLRFGTNNGTERMRIKSDGNVGIGTDDPAYLFDVSDDSSNIAIFRSSVTNYARVIIRAGAAGDAQLSFQNNTSTKWTIGNDGGDSDKFKIETGGGAFGASPLVCILSGGNFGIGTTAAATKLHVEAGTIYANAAQSNTLLSASSISNTVTHNLIGSDGYWGIRTAINNSFNLDIFNGGSPKVALSILNDGNVGIGITAPLGILSLPGADTTTKPQIRFQTGAAANLADAAISTTDDSGGTNVMIGANQYWSGGSITRFDTGRSGSAIDFGYAGRMKFYTGEGSAAPTERMRIERDGNVGIGTTAPVAQLNLFKTGADDAISSSLYFQRAAGHYGCAILQVGNGSAGTEKLMFTAGHNSNPVAIGNAKMTIQQDGNVGIGTTTPAALLHLKGGTATNEASHILFENTQGAKKFAIGGGGSGVTNNGLGFRNVTDNTLPMIIDDSGKVGIGVTAPVAKLHIDDSATGDNKGLYIQNTHNTDGDSAAIRFGFAGNDNANKGGIFFKRTANYGRGSLIFATENTQTNDNVDASDAKLTILADGKVGINDSSPTYKLDVNGTGRFTGALTASTVTASDGGGFIGSGASLTDLNGTNISSGTVAAARLGSGTADSSTFLRGDNTWVANANGTVTSITAGSGLSGGTITTSGTIANTDKGSSQNIFKKVRTSNSVGNQLGLSTANSNDDTIDFRQGTGITLATSGDVVTITAATNGTVTGTGTAGYLPRWSTTTNLADSIVSENSGKIGINIDPAVALHVLGDAVKFERTDNAVALQLYNNHASPADDAALGYLQFMGKDNDGTANIVHSEVRGGVQSNSNTAVNGYLAFLTTNNGTAVTEWMRILSDGNVGIGTNAPGEKLDVRGEVYILTGSTSVRTLSGILKADTLENSAGASDLTIQTEAGGNKDILLMPNGTGNVGIGTTSPRALLDVSGGSILASGRSQPTAGAGLEIGYNSSTPETMLISYDWTASSYRPIRFNTLSYQFQCSGSTKAVIDSSGKVGIGTTGPDVRFHVETSVADVLSKFINTDGTNGHGLLVKAGGSASGKYIATFRDAANNTRMHLLADGNVGIGITAPANLLHVYSTGNAEIKAERASGAVILTQAQSALGKFGTTSNHDLQLMANNTGYLKIKTSGNVEIASASTILYGDGDALFSGAAANMSWDKSDSALEFQDNAKIKLGTDDDLQIYHDGTHSYIDGTTTGDLYVRSLNDDVVIQAADDVFIYTQAGENAIIARGNGKVELFYDGSSKLATSSVGTTVTGILNVDTVNNNANSKNIIYRGASTDTIVGGGTAPEKLYVYDNGNVGIGTTTNNQKLIVKGAENENGIITADVTTTGYITALLLRNAGNDKWLINNDGGNSHAFEIYNYTAAENAITITASNSTVTISNGSLLPGSTNAQSLGNTANRWNLYANTGDFGGSIYARAGIKDDGGDFGTNGQVLTTNGVDQVNWVDSPGAGSVDGSGTDNYIPRWNGTTALQDSSIVALDSGIVGIGTNAPNAAGASTNNSILSLKGKATAYGGILELINYGTSGNGQSHGVIRFLDNTAENAQIEVLRHSAADDARMDFKTRATGGSLTTRLTIADDGNVGVGTNNPSRLLDVNGTAYFRDDIYFGNTVLNVASGFATQTGMGWDKSTGELQIASTTNPLQLGRHGSTGSIFVCRYESVVKATLDTSGNMSLAGTLSESSSIAIKENVETYSPSLENISKMRPVRFNKKKSKKKEVGLVAEELAEMFPELVETDKDGKPSGVNYSRAVAVLLHGFKELYKEVKELKEKI